MTAATATHLIEQVGPVSPSGRWQPPRQVNLCEQQGGQWITIRRNITQRTAESFGFNLDSPAVQRVFART